MASYDAGGAHFIIKDGTSLRGDLVHGEVAVVAEEDLVVVE